MSAIETMTQEQMEAEFKTLLRETGNLVQRYLQYTTADIDTTETWSKYEELRDRAIILARHIGKDTEKYPWLSFVRTYWASELKAAFRKAQSEARKPWPLDVD